MAPLFLTLLLTTTPPADCAAVTGPAGLNIELASKRDASVERVIVDPTGARTIITCAPLASPAVFRPQGLTLIGARDGRLLVEADPALCKAGVISLHVDDAVGRGVQVVHVDARGALLLKEGRLFWWGDPPPRFQMVWRSDFDVSVANVPVVNFNRRGFR